MERVASLKSQVALLVREGRHEEALEKLYELSALMPEATDVQASLEQVKEFFVTRYAKALGGLDQIAPTEPVRQLRSPEAIAVQRLANGRATYEDVLRSSSLGRVRTLQLLCELYGSDEVYALATRGRPRLTQDLPARDNPLRHAKLSRPTISRPELPSSAATETAPLPSGVVPLPSVAVSAPRPAQNVAAPAPPAVLVPVPAPASTSSAPRSAESNWLRQADPENEFKQAFAQGMSAYVARRYDQADEAFSRCLQLDPRHEQAAVMLARVKRENLK